MAYTVSNPRSASQGCGRDNQSRRFSRTWKRFLVKSSFGSHYLWCIGPTANWNGICMFTARDLFNNLTYEYPSKLLATLLISIFSSHTRMAFYEIYPDSHIPHFRQVGVLAAPGPVIEASVSADIIALHHSSITADHGSRLSVWKYSEYGRRWAIDSSLCSVSNHI